MTEAGWLAFAQSLLAFWGGAVVGSFVLVLVDRLHRHEPWAMDRSRCEYCKRTLRARDLVPIVSYVLLRGRCAHCGERIAGWHLGAELLCGALFVVAVWLTPELQPTLLAARLLVVSVAAALILSDVRHGTLPDVLTLPALAIVLAYQALSGNGVSAIVGAVVGGLFYLLQLVVSKGRWVGAGDVRIGFLVGALVGWPYLLLALLIAYVGGAIVSLVLLATKTVKLTSAVPFGAFLLPAALVVQWFGATLLGFFLPLSG